MGIAELFLEILKFFNFTQLTSWIAVISTILFASSLAGGMLSGMSFAHSKRGIVLPLTDRISFRLFMLSELLLLIFVVYYHSLMLGSITISHIIYWVSAMVAMPLLAVIGSEIMKTAYSGKIKAREEAQKRIRRAQRKKREDAEARK